MSSFKINNELSEIYNSITLLETKLSSTDTISSSGTIDLNSNIIIVNNLAGDINLTLPTPNSNQQNNVYSIQTLYMSGGIVTVSTNTGTFKLDPSNNYVNLIYLNNKWMKINSDNTSFYPTTKQTKIIPSDASPNALFGNSVSLSADGNTLAIGGPNDGSDLGATWVYTRSGSSWATNQQKIIPGDASATAYFGQSVSLSANGNTLAIGGNSDNNGVGATWVYTRSGGNWTNPPQKISPPTGDYTTGSSPYFGKSVSLSADGNTLAIGGPNDGSDLGSTWVYTRSGGSWAKQTKIIPPTGDASAYAQFGQSVSLSADGNTLAIGGPFDSGDVGSIWVYTRSGGSWAKQTKISPPTGDASPNAQFGKSVSLSADGNTLAIGGFGDSNVGSTWVYIRSGTVWTNPPQKISPVDASSNAQFGRSVSLSADGNTLAIGGSSDSSDLGATWVYTRSGGSWVTNQPKISPPTGDASSNAQFGRSVSLSADGNTLAIGGFYDNSGKGSTWVYV